MKLYSSFLVRCWVLREETQAERITFEVEHIQQGQHWRGLTPAEALAQMLQICQHAQPETEVGELEEDLQSKTAGVTRAAAGEAEKPAKLG